MPLRRELTPKPGGSPQPTALIWMELKLGTGHQE